MHRDVDQALPGRTHEQPVAAADQGTAQKNPVYSSVDFAREIDRHCAVPFSRLPRVAPWLMSFTAGAVLPPFRISSVNGCIAFNADIVQESHVFHKSVYHDWCSGS